MEFRKDDVTKVFLLLRGFAEWSEIFQILAFNLYEFQNTKDYLGSSDLLLCPLIFSRIVYCYRYGLHHTKDALAWYSLFSVLR